MLVVDASVLVKVLTREEGTPEARTLLVDADGVLATDFITLEVASALSKKVRHFGLPSEQARLSLEAIPQFVSEFVPFDQLIRPAFDLSLRLRHAVQDCVYLALALERRCRLATSDLKFAERVRSGGLGNDLITVGR